MQSQLQVKVLPGEGAANEFDQRLVAFIRLGTDFKDNYYQIEVFKTTNILKQ